MLPEPITPGSGQLKPVADTVSDLVQIGISADLKIITDFLQKTIESLN